MYVNYNQKETTETSVSSREDKRGELSKLMKQNQFFLGFYPMASININLTFFFKVYLQSDKKKYESKSIPPFR